MGFDSIYYGQYRDIHVGDNRTIILPDDIVDMMKSRNEGFPGGFESESKLVHHVLWEYPLWNSKKPLSVRCYDRKAYQDNQKSLKYQKVYNSCLEARHVIVIPQRLVQCVHLENKVFIAASQDGQTFNIWKNEQMFIHAGLP